MKKIKANMNRGLKQPEEAAATKEKHEGKAWKNLSSAEKDEILFLLAKASGLVPEDMEYGK